MYEEVHSFAVDNLDLPFRISLTGISYCDGSYHMVRHKSRSCVIEYVVSGEGTIIANGNHFTAKADDVYLLHMGRDYEYFSDSCNPWVKIFFNIRGEFIEELLKCYGLEDQHIIHNSNAEQLFREAYEMVKAGKNEKQVFNRLAGKITEIVATLSDCFYMRNVDVGEMAKVRNYIETHTDRIVRNEELQKLIFRSGDYLIKHFTTEYGMSPYDYQIMIKIQTAKKLLKNTGLSVRAISEMLGYNDQHYFSNLFRQKCGMSPSSYRKKDCSVGIIH